MSAQSPQSVLVLDGPASERTGETCLDFMPRSQRSMDVLTVCDGASVDERDAQLRRHGERVASTAFVAVNHGTSHTPRTTEPIRRVSSPADLTGIGLGVIEWVTDRSGEYDRSVCIDGVSTMIEYTGLEQVFRLLHALEGKCRDHGATLHVHLREAAHDETAIGTLRQVFDEQRRGHAERPGVAVEAGGVIAGADARDGPGD